MAIKYHQWGNGSEYGEDRVLTNNWNPDADYGNEYSNVYFNIDTNGYGYPNFCFTDEDRTAFDKDIAEVFTALGWKCEREEHNGSCAEWHKGKSHLYMHPQQLSGDVLKNEIKAIAEALTEETTVIKLRWVDLHDTVYNMTDDEYEEILTTKNSEIKSAILETCKTSRVNKFKTIDDISRYIADKFRVRRIGVNDGRNGDIGQTATHIIDVIQALIADGYIVTPDSNDKLIRTINKAEQKQRKLVIN